MPEPITKTVLVVDDEPAVTRVIQMQLEIEGYTVVVRRTAAEAYEAVASTNFFAVLLDLGLQDVSGFDVLQKFKQLKPSLPVIIVTGDRQEKDGIRAFELGAWDYVTKPIDFKYLKNILSLQPPA